MRRSLKIFLSFVLSDGLTVWTLVKSIFDWVGRSTFIEDWGQLVNESVPSGIAWMLQTPAWVPALLVALVVALFAYWLFNAPQPKAKGVRVASASRKAKQAAPLSTALKVNTDSLSSSESLARSDDHHLVPAQHGYFRFNCARTVDGHDLRFGFALRNRSKLNLDVVTSGARFVRLSNGAQGIGQGALQRPFRPGTEQRVSSGSVSC